jgi:hypothetical protein
MVPKMGRPRHGEGEKRKALNLRTTDLMRNLLETAATENGLSLTQEVERRLTASFNLTVQGTRDPVLGPLLQRFAAITDLAQQRTGKEWQVDPETFWAVRAGFNELIDRLMPDEPAWAATVSGEGDGERLDRIEDWKMLGKDIARAVHPRAFRNFGLQANEVKVSLSTLTNLWPED